MSELDTSRLEVAAQAPEGTTASAQAPVSSDAAATDSPAAATPDTVNTPSESTDKTPTPTTKAEVLTLLRQYVEQPETSDRAILDRLRNVFYRLHNDGSHGQLGAVLPQLAKHIYIGTQGQTSLPTKFAFQHLYLCP